MKYNPKHAVIMNRYTKRKVVLVDYLEEKKGFFWFI
jgi:hypothetical protein